MTFVAITFVYLATVIGSTEQSEPHFELSYPGTRFRVSQNTAKVIIGSKVYLTTNNLRLFGQSQKVQKSVLNFRLIQLHHLMNIRGYGTSNQRLRIISYKISPG